MSAGVAGRALLVALPRRTAGRLAAEAAAAGLEAAVVARIDERGAGAMLVVLGAAGRGDIEDALAAADADGAPLVVAPRTPDARRAALSAGVPIVDAAAGWDEILRAADLAGRAVGRGRVIAVWGPVGSPGRTTVALGLAAELSALGRRVLVIDADTYGAAVAPALGLLDESAGLAAACRSFARGAGPAEVIGHALPHDGLDPAVRFGVLSGIGRASRWPELSGDDVGGVLDAVVGRVDDVVVDAGFCLERDEEISSDMFAPRRNAATIAVLERADLLLAVAAADPIGVIRIARELPAAVELAAGARVTLVANRTRWVALGAGPAEQAVDAIERLSGLRPIATLPHDVRAADAAIAHSATVREVAPRSALVQALRSLAVQLTPAAAGAARPGRGRRSAVGGARID